MKKLITGSVAALLALVSFHSGAQVIFSEDFVNGIPGTWTTMEIPFMPTYLSSPPHGLVPRTSAPQETLLPCPPLGTTPLELRTIG